MIIQPTNGGRFVSARRLPDGYQELKCLIKNGYKPYINTELPFSDTHKYMIDFERTGKFNYIMGADTRWDNGDINISVDLSRSLQGLRITHRGKNFSSSPSLVPVPPVGERIMINIDVPNTTYGYSIYSAIWVAGTNDIVGNPVYMFTTNRNRVAQVSSDFEQNYKIYSYVVMDEDTKLQEFVPAMLTSTSKPGFYDLVSNSFFTNAGDGEFGYETLDGDVVPSRDS